MPSAELSPADFARYVKLLARGPKAIERITVAITARDVAVRAEERAVVDKLYGVIRDMVDDWQRANLYSASMQQRFDEIDRIMDRARAPSPAQDKRFAGNDSPGIYFHGGDDGEETTDG